MAKLNKRIDTWPGWRHRHPDTHLGSLYEKAKNVTYGTWDSTHTGHSAGRSVILHDFTIGCNVKTRAEVSSTRPESKLY
jgi:hypothetical protein